MASVHFHHAFTATYGAGLAGHNRQNLLLQAGINEHALNSEHSRVSDAQMSRLVQSIWRLLQDEFMGFTPSPCKPGTFAFMLRCIRNSGHLYQALKRGTEFYNLVTDDITTQVFQTPFGLEIEFEFRQPDKDPDHFFHEFWFVIWHRLACWLSGKQLPLVQVHFQYDAPNHERELAVMFPAKLVFSQSKNKLILDSQSINAELIRSETDVEHFLRSSPFELLTIPGFDNSVSTEIKQALLHAYEQGLGILSLSQITAASQYSAATLHRRLLAEGTSFQKIKEQLKQDLAIQLLVHEHKPIYAIAEQVGFADARSLTRAFKKWTGLSPRAYVNLHKSQQK